MEKYYFPFDELKNGQVYTYESMTEPKMVDEVWYYKTLDRNGSHYLAAQAYDENWRVSQLAIEKKTDLGMITDSVLIYLPDTNETDIPIHVKVTNRATFPFYRKPDDTLLYRINWTEPSTGLEYTLDRKRVFVGDTVYRFDGKTHSAVRFDVFEELETFIVTDGATSSAWSGSEVYAEDIGLVYYKKEIGEGFIKEYRLVKISSGDAFFESLDLKKEGE